jgi:hypothetical protein
VDGISRGAVGGDLSDVALEKDFRRRRDTRRIKAECWITGSMEYWYPH